MINILLCGNDKVFDGFLTTMLSILKRNESKETFTFYIYTMDVSYIDPKYEILNDYMADILDRTAKKYNKDNKVIKIDVIDLYKKEFANSPNENCYASPYTLLRLFADIVPNMPDKLIYLDIDLIVNRDIKLLWDIDVSNYEYAAARDQYGKFLIKPNYINAGVLLFNLKKMKETKILEKARQLIKTKKLVFADQSALIRSTTKRKMLPQRFNCQAMLTKRCVIRHFSKRLYWLPYPHVENIKQWHVDKVHYKLKYHQFDDVLNEYLAIKNTYFKED